MSWLVVSDNRDARYSVLKRLGEDVSKRQIHSIGHGWEVIEAHIPPNDSRAYFITNQVETGTREGVEMAVLEMWALGLSTQILTSEESSFADVSHGLFPKPTYVVLCSCSASWW